MRRKESFTCAGVLVCGLVTNAHLRTPSLSQSRAPTAWAPSSMDRYSGSPSWKMLAPSLPGTLCSRITEPGVQGRVWR